LAVGIKPFAVFYFARTENCKLQKPM